jgi:hypothetical protein
LAEDLALGPLYNCANGHHYRVPFKDALMEQGIVEHVGDLLPGLTGPIVRLNVASDNAETYIGGEDAQD